MSELRICVRCDLASRDTDWYIYASKRDRRERPGPELYCAICVRHMEDRLIPVPGPRDKAE